MGKVHGSLARAGKVKSQTPKVHATTLSQMAAVQPSNAAFLHPPHEPWALQRCSSDLLLALMDAGYMMNEKLMRMVK